MRLAHAKRRDKNEREIIDALKKVGAEVLQIDVVDLIVYYRGTLFLMEVKRTGKDLNEGQRELAKKWPIHVVRSIDDAFLAAGVIAA